MMSGWNQMGSNGSMGMNQNSSMVGGGNMLMGNYGMNQPYQMGGGQMMYQQSYMQQPMYQQPMMNSYNNVNNPAQPMPPQAPLPSGGVPDQPPPPAPSEPPPPSSAAPLPPSDDKRMAMQPPPPNSAKEWWKTELENLTDGSSRKELQALTATDWFLAMDTSQQIEYWQHKMQLQSNQEASGKSQSYASQSYGSSNAPSQSIQSRPSPQDTQKQSVQSSSGDGDKPQTDVAPDWDKASGENPETALSRYETQLKKLNEQAQVFEKQYTDWRKQFDDWKEKHRNHPNKTQFNQYEKQWVTWQKQMLEQKKQNEANKERLLKNVEKIHLAIEEEKRAKERAQQMSYHQRDDPGFRGPPQYGSENLYQQPKPPIDYPQGGYNQQERWVPPCSQGYNNEKQGMPPASEWNRGGPTPTSGWGHGIQTNPSQHQDYGGAYNENMNPPRSQFDQPLTNQPPTSIADPQQGFHQNRGVDNMQWPRMSPNQQRRIPDFSQPRPQGDANLRPPELSRIPNFGQQRPIGDTNQRPSEHLQMPSFSQHRLSGNTNIRPPEHPRMPGFNQERPRADLNQRLSDQQSMSGFNQERPPGGANLRPPWMEHESPSKQDNMPIRFPMEQSPVRPKRRNEYDEKGNLIRGGEDASSDFIPPPRFGDNSQPRPRFSSNPRFRHPGDNTQRPDFPDESTFDEDYEDQSYSNDHQQMVQNFPPRPRHPGEFQQRMRFPGDHQLRPRFPGNLSQRLRFPGSRPLRPRFPGNQAKRPRFLGDEQSQFLEDDEQDPSYVEEEEEDEPSSDFPGNQQHRPRFPGDPHQRHRFPGSRFPQTRFRNDDQIRPRFPGETRLQRPRLGESQLRPRFPRGLHPRARFPTDEPQEQHFSDEQNAQFSGVRPQRPRIPIAPMQRPRFPGDQHPRSRFPGDPQQRMRMPARFPGDIPRPRFTGDIPRFPDSSVSADDNASGSSLGGKPSPDETAITSDHQENDFAQDDEYNEWDSQLASGPRTKTSETNGVVEDQKTDDHINHPDDISTPSMQQERFGSSDGPRFFQPRGPRPRFMGRGVPPGEFGKHFSEDCFDGGGLRGPRPRAGLRPRFPLQPPLRGRLPVSSRSEGQDPPLRFGIPRNRFPFEQEQKDWSMEEREEPQPEIPPKDTTSETIGKEDLGMKAVQKLASNPLFSGDNLKKLQEQLKVITQEKREPDESENSKLEYRERPVDKHEILQKAKNLTSLDLRNILSAVKQASAMKLEKENENRSFGRQPGGARGAGDDYKKPSKPDPLLESLEALAAMGALEDDRILQEYLRSDPLLEEELYMRAMEDEELFREAQRFDRPKDWPNRAPPHGRPRGRGPDDFDRLPDRPEWRRDEGPPLGERRRSIGDRPRDLRRDSPPLSVYVYPPEDSDERMDRHPPYDRSMPRRTPPGDRPMHDHPGEPMRRPGPGDFEGRGRSPIRDLRDADQREIERQSIERRHIAISRDLESVKQRRETLDSVYVYDERDDERAQRERSLERLRRCEEDLREREREILAREQALREALRQHSPPRKRYRDDDHRRPDDPYMRRGPDDRDSMRLAYPPAERFGSPPRMRRSPGRDYDRPRPGEFRERDDRGRGRRSPSPRREPPMEARRREMMDRNRDRPSPRRRTPPRKLRRSRSPPRGTRDEFGRELNYRGGRPGLSPHSHEPSPRRFDGDKRLPERGDTSKPTPNMQRQRPASPTGPQVSIIPTGKPLTFADLQEPQENLATKKPDGPKLVNIEDIINTPGRLKRAEKIALILRGLPGSGKTHIAKMIRDKESTFKVSARVLGLDDYFMTEVEKTIKDPDTGKTTKKRVFEYEYEEDMEESYRGNLVRSFKKTLDDGYFTFVIMDAINDKLDYFSECYNTAKSNGFEVYVAEITADVHVCARRNVHERSLADIQTLEKSWEKTPDHMNRVDLRQLLQDSSIQEVEMGDITDSDEEKEKKKPNEKAEESQETPPSSQEVGVPKSKWETESAALDKLDGISKKVVKKQSMEDFLSVTEDYKSRESAPGKKRVRWADINERQNQQRMRDVGFVVGQTDWSRMMDDSHATQALNRTKFI